MLFVAVLKTLWALLERRRRVAFCALIALMFVSGLLEMTGMLALLGYTRGLIPDEETGVRGGAVAEGLHRIFGAVDQFDYVLFGGLLVIGIMFTKNVLSTSVHFMLNRFLMKLNERVSRRLFEGYLLAPYEVFNARGVSKPASNINKAFELFSTCFGATAQIIADTATLTMVALLLLIVDPYMTLGGVLIFGGAGVLLYRKTHGVLTDMGAKQSASKREVTRHLRQGLDGVIEGRLNNTRSLFVDNYVRALGATSLIRRRRLLIDRLPSAMNEVMLATSIVAAVLYLTVRGYSIAEALPTLAIFAFAGLRLQSAMSRVSRGLQRIRQRYSEFKFFHAAVEEVAPSVFHERADEPSPSYLADERDMGEGFDGRLRKELELRGAHFKYPGAKHATIRGISLKIPRGSFVSFCGQSGGGKTTLLLMLMGMLKPTKGKVLCDNKSVKFYIRKWHQNIGYVGQRVYIADGTLRENVAFGLPREQVDDDRVREVLEMAQAKFLKKWKHGLDTRLKEGGSNLSGGQRQRIAIARALYKDPEIIVFDEATAALDNLTERAVSEAIGALSGKKTIIVVAHRLSTIRNSDCIHLMHAGRIAASGTYDELLAESEAFRKLERAGMRVAAEEEADAIEPPEAGASASGDA